MEENKTQALPGEKPDIAASENAGTTPDGNGERDELRGKRPPRESLKASIGYVEKAFELGGKSNNFDVLIKAVGTTSTKSGTFGIRIYTPQNFGFWTVTPRLKEYELTDLGMQLVNPDGPNARLNAIQNGFRKIETLRMIWDNYKGNSLPADEYFPNSLVKLGIPEELKKEWANYFTESARFAELLDANRYVKLGATSAGEKQAPIEQKQNVYEAPPVPPLMTPVPLAGVDALQEFLRGRKGNISRKTISNDREVLIFIPEDLSQKDVKQIRVLLKAVEASLEGYTIDEE